MNDDGRGGDQHGVHRELLAEILQPCRRLHFHQREERTHGRAQQPFGGHQSRFHPTQQQREMAHVKSQWMCEPLKIDGQIHARATRKKFTL